MSKICYCNIVLKKSRDEVSRKYRSLFSFYTAQKSLPNKNSPDGKAGKLTSTIPTIVYGPHNIKEFPQKIWLIGIYSIPRLKLNPVLLCGQKQRCSNNNKYCQVWSHKNFSFPEKITQQVKNEGVNWWKLDVRNVEGCKFDFLVLVIPAHKSSTWSHFPNAR